MNTELYLTIYQHCVKPILLYCSEIWSLDFIVNKNDLTQIEQRYESLQSEKNPGTLFEVGNGST